MEADATRPDQILPEPLEETESCRPAAGLTFQTCKIIAVTFKPQTEWLTEWLRRYSGRRELTQRPFVRL